MAAATATAATTATAAATFSVACPHHSSSSYHRDRDRRRHHRRRLPRLNRAALPSLPLWYRRGYRCRLMLLLALVTRCPSAHLLTSVAARSRLTIVITRFRLYSIFLFSHFILPLLHRILYLRLPTRPRRVCACCRNAVFEFPFRLPFTNRQKIRI